MRKKVVTVYAWIAGCGIAYLMWIKLTGVSMPCFYLMLTGAKCPGCGITSMFVSMSEFDFVSAFQHNPVVFILLVVWNIIAILCVSEKIEFVTKPRILYAFFWISIALLIVFGIVRNF